jgi:hypothetical protein
MEFPKLSLQPEIAENFPDLKLGCLVSEVLVEEPGADLLQSMQSEIEALSTQLDAEKM